MFFGLINYTSGQNDTIVLINNDQIIGEIKNLEQGVLKMKTPYSDKDFKIEWDKVKEIYTYRSYVINLSSGKHTISNLIQTVKPGSNLVYIVKDTIKSEIKLDDIVYIAATENNMKGRLNVLIDFGYTITKANNLNQISGTGNIEYLTHKWKLNTGISSLISIQDNSDQINRTSGDIGINRFLQKNWFVLYSLDLLKNDELDIKLRTTNTIGLGKYLFRTNMMFLGTAVGGGWNNENFSDSLQTQNNSAELLIGLEYKFYDYKDLSIYINAVVYPSLTIKGRVRFDSKIDMKYEFPFDLYLKLGIVYDFDNQSSDGFSKDDYSVQTSIGWKFN